jgi:hypothetical protein
MFRGKINRSNSGQLLNVLERLRNGDRGVFTVNTLFNSEAGLHESCIKLDLFCNKVMFGNKIVGTITALHPLYYFIKTKKITVK